LIVTQTDLSRVSKARVWIGRALSGLSALFMILDGAMKIPKPEFVVKATTELGYPESVITPLGIVLLACTALYLIPRTSVLGAILLTGYLGGAVASHLRKSDGAFAVLFPVIFAAMLWGGLCLRHPAVGAVVFGKRPPQ
jgi:hypothetical protein